MSDWLDESYFEHLNGVDLYFEQVGNPGNSAVIYLHGGPGYNSFSFRDLIGEDLSRYQMVYLDQRGSGRSEELKQDTLLIDDLVEDLEAVRSFLGLETFSPLGHGFGAMIALEYGRRYPQHVEKIIVVSPWIHMPELALELLKSASEYTGKPFEDPRAEILKNLKEEEYPLVGAARVEQAFNLLNARDLLNHMQFKDVQSRMRLEFSDVEAQLLGSGEVQEAFVRAGLWEFEYPGFLVEQECPIFALVGQHDRTSYPDQVQWLEDLAGAEITVLDAGHYPWLDAPEDFVEALDRILLD
ncbi:alpha/beta fold hydrolase [Deinococcus roseus]|uniref:Proline iminopeptidase n=1 Tax=Deinococcus roseus TaxID=392414 RepID=A0ABQ2D2B4_9DEIO|nr:alpha/beta hydrolase [Deinococcus roseus]GGJ41049.1 proline iminopeptidase [Deinococcus roseus]